MEPTSPTSPALADGFFTRTTLEAAYRDTIDKIPRTVEFGKCFPVEISGMFPLSLAVASVTGLCRGEGSGCPGRERKGPEDLMLLECV